MDDILIIGAGQAGMQIAVSLRDHGFTGPITLAGSERATPYQRPPLSKAYLSGEADVESLELRAQSFYDERDITVRCDDAVVSVAFDGDAGMAVTASGARIPFAQLALTPGSEPRRISIPGSDLSGVLYLRDLADADELKARWGAAESVVVIGGGFIGLEVAAAARKAGKTVTVLEAADRLIARAVSPITSEFFKKAHSRRGIDVRVSVQVSGIRGADGVVTGVELSDGEVVPADIVLVGIGVIPRSALAEQLGLELVGGAIVVDEFARTSDSRVVAAGDAVLMPHPLGRAGQVRLESVQNAVDQAKVAAATLLGVHEPYRAVPWFWSDQADLKLQIAGLSTGFDQTVVRGNPDDDHFSVLYYAEGKLIAVDTVNDAPDYMVVRRALGQGATIPAELASDTSVSLKSLLVPDAA
jgi:3-phenylpropionate/trans-cinnamate dioxygenase ferredoxin reductase subunit